MEINDALLINIFLLLVVLFICFICFFFIIKKKYRQIDSLIRESYERKDGKLISMPESFDKKMDSLIKDHEDFKNNYKNFKEKLQEFLTKNITNINQSAHEVKNNLEEINNITQNQYSELERYKKGYDYNRHKSLAKSLIHSLKTIEKGIFKIKDENSLNSLNIYIRDLKKILSDIGVVEWLPELGQSIDNVNGIEVVSTEETDDKLKNNTVSSVVSRGFTLELEVNQKAIVIEKSFVNVFQFKVMNL